MSASKRRKDQKKFLESVGPAFQGMMSVALGGGVTLNDFILYRHPGWHCRGCGGYSKSKDYRWHHCSSDVVTELQRRERREREKSMSNVIICDRCGQIATTTVAGWIDFHANPNAKHKEYGICPECSRLFWEWVGEPNRDPRTIMKAFDPDAVQDNGPTQAETSRAALEAEYGNGD